MNVCCDCSFTLNWKRTTTLRSSNVKKILMMRVLDLKDFSPLFDESEELDECVYVQKELPVYMVSHIHTYI